MHVCDDCFVMNTADANNTTLNPTILNNGLQGADSPANYVIEVNTVTTGTTLTGMAVSDDFTTALPDQIFVRKNNQIFKNSTCRSIRYDANSAGFTDFQWDLSTLSKRAACVFGLVHLGYTDQSPGGSLVDIWRFTSVNGDFTVFQLSTGTGDNPNGFAVNLETSKPSNPTHSSYIVVTPGNDYWVCMMTNNNTTAAGGGKCYLALYNAAPPYTLVGSISSTTWSWAAAGDELGDLRIGNSEQNTDSAGHYLYFKGTCLDYTTPRFPVPPQEPNARFPNRGSRPAPFRPGIAR
jgi:hypothetical protein